MIDHTSILALEDAEDTPDEPRTYRDNEGGRLENVRLRRSLGDVHSHLGSLVVVGHHEEPHLAELAN